MKLKDINDYQEEIINEKIEKIRNKLNIYDVLSNGAIHCSDRAWAIIDLALFTYELELDKRIKEIKETKNYEDNEIN